jgi:hypothetical protein
MHIRPNTLVIDADDIHITACSAEPMRRADHKSKKHARPARKSETLGGGHFVFRRYADGRIHPRQDPFEHGTLAEAVTEMERLVSRHGGEFEVFSRVGGVKWEAVDEYRAGMEEFFSDESQYAEMEAVTLAMHAEARRLLAERDHSLLEPQRRLLLEGGAA